jgi:hypothetical protein
MDYLHGSRVAGAGARQVLGRLTYRDAIQPFSALVFDAVVLALATMTIVFKISTV